MSDSNTSSSSSGGIGVCGLLGIVFVVLKLTGYITWSWWYVTLPFWGLFALVLCVVLVMAIVVGCIDLTSEYFERRRIKILRAIKRGEQS